MSDRRLVLPLAALLALALGACSPSRHGSPSYDAGSDDSATAVAAEWAGMRPNYETPEDARAETARRAADACRAVNGYAGAVIAEDIPGGVRRAPLRYADYVGIDCTPVDAIGIPTVGAHVLSVSYVLDGTWYSEDMRTIATDRSNARLILDVEIARLRIHRRDDVLWARAAKECAVFLGQHHLVPTNPGGIESSHPPTAGWADYVCYGVPQSPSGAPRFHSIAIRDDQP